MSWVHLCITRDGSPVETETGCFCVWCGTTQAHKWLNSNQAGKLLGIRNTDVIEMVRAGDIMGKCTSDQWRISRAHVESIVSGSILVRGKVWSR